MPKQLFDLPDELLFYILGYINNIREKIRLASVNSTFHRLVFEACRIQPYKLVNHSDYMYESEYKKVDNKDRIINLHKLLGIAPRLTHFVDKIYHFDYINNCSTSQDTDVQYRVPLSLTHGKYICLDLCKSYFFGRQYSTAFDRKATVVLSNIPAVTTLDIRTDKDYNIEFQQLNHLKVYKLNFYVTASNTRFQAFSLRLFDLIKGAPNLEELYFSSRYVDIGLNLPEFLDNLALKCPNLKALKIFFQRSHYPVDVVYSNFTPFNGNNKLNELEYLDLRGFFMPLAFWDKLLSLTPNLKFFAFDPMTDREINRIIARHCRNVKYNKDRPFEIEEEYRVYNQKTYGFDADRYL